jgi:hypothetical protein
MKITVWLATMDRRTWTTAAEVLILAGIVWIAPGALVRILVGIPLLAHVGYLALTSLPMGVVPRRAEGGQSRRHYDLRERVVRFLEEVRRVEHYAEQARVGGIARKEIDEQVRSAQRRVMNAAVAVAQATGRSSDPEPKVDGALFPGAT